MKKILNIKNLIIVSIIVILFICAYKIPFTYASTNNTIYTRDELSEIINNLSDIKFNTTANSDYFYRTCTHCDLTLPSRTVVSFDFSYPTGTGVTKKDASFIRDNGTTLTILEEGLYSINYFFGKETTEYASYKVYIDTSLISVSQSNTIYDDESTIFYANANSVLKINISSFNTNSENLNYSNVFIRKLASK